ncbi:histidine kinase [uncultured Psychroserpens sp.]|uniref:sensor histidine kinase n=1 Tax=uncultured Psychroserpens sp. TaxID=255436 RepID=UPI0026328295|nr:histidine kinase [uncultured Psychroserpens sp.]
MKRLIEIILNVVLWALAMHFIIRIFSFETESVTYYDIGGLESITKTYNYKLQYALKTTFIFKIVFFYLNLFYFSKLFFLKKYLKYILLLIVSIAILLVAEWILLSYTCEILCFESYKNIGIGLYIFLVVISLIYSSFLQWKKDLKIKNQLEQQTTKTELKLLRSQLNPHFLFNNLNNLLYISRKEKQTEVSKGIKGLSELLRFMLYDNSQEKIFLKKEIQFINSFIDLNKLRFEKTDDIKITFDIYGDTENIKITPSLLIPFVENAFKHGIDIYQKSYIAITLTVEKNNIIFTVTNSISTEAPIAREDSGVGLENVKKRLNILYKNKHNLKIIKAPNTFTIKLQLEVDIC